MGADHPDVDVTATAAAVLAAIPAWWRTRAAALGLDGEWLDVGSAINIPRFYDGGVPPLEREWGPLTAEQVGMAYVEALAPSTRARHGRYYTPSLLAEHLWSSARRALGLSREIRPLQGLVRDPASGGGALLLPPLREHISALHDADPQFVINSLPSLIEGVDNDPAAVWVANVVLASEMLPLLAQVPSHRRRPLPGLVRLGDGLAEDRPALVTLMNPPYGRVRLSEQDRARFGDVVYGHANLYAMFMAAGVANTVSTGALAAIVPTSFMSGRYFEPLRGKLIKDMVLSGAAFVEDRSGVFSTVLQETCIAAFTGRRVRRARIESIGSSATYVATVASPRTSNPWIIPRRSDLAFASAVASALPLTLRSAGWRVRTGPLVWNRHKDDLHPRPGKDRYKVVWAADIKTGELRYDKSRADKRYVGLPSTSFMLQRDPCVLVQRTSAPEQDRRVVAAQLQGDDLDSGPVVIENHVNILVPSDAPMISARVLVVWLRSQAVDRVARCLSGSVALSAYELESMPLPRQSVLEAWEKLPDEQLDAAITEAYARVEA